MTKLRDFLPGAANRARAAKTVTEIGPSQSTDNILEIAEQFQQLAENIREVFFIMTPDPPKAIYVSPAYEEIWGQSGKELLAGPERWFESVHEEDRGRAAAFFEGCMRGNESELKYRIVRPDGSIRWVDSRAFPVFDARGKFTRVVGIAEDITLQHDALEKLNDALAEAERQAPEHAKLSELLEILQSCQTSEEAYRVAKDCLPAVLPSVRSGALCMTSASRNIVEATVLWGDTVGTEKTFRPEDCWALRRGKVHRVADPTTSLRCAHVSRNPADGYLCVPLAAQGETLGVLYLECWGPASPRAQGQATDPFERSAQQATAVGERISLALANLRLREVLRGQSLRDALTGLFNRRYMEESVEREIRRAIRNEQPLALLMIDIDHFKRFNDTFGHQAGDTLLRALGDFLITRTRGQDCACRYGGEEFALILSGVSLEAAHRRAELLREDLKLLSVEYAGQVLGSITLSIGVAAFPGHATPQELLHAADQALYRAKAEGRDRIVLG